MTTKLKDSKNRKIILKDAEGNETAELKEKDVAIIIRENLDLELFFPHRADDEDVEEAEVQGLAVVVALSDPDLFELIMGKAEEKLQEAQKVIIDEEVDEKKVLN